MKYSKTALGLLNAQYRSVLRKCMLINLGLFAITAIAATPANADTPIHNSVDGPNGIALLFNENDGGGAMFTNNDGTVSYVGVNDGGADGLTAQIYSKNSSTNVGTRLNITNDGIYYTVGKTDGSYADGDQLTTITSVGNQITTALANGDNAYQTASDVASYVANNAVQTVTKGTANGTISVDGGADVLIYDDSALQTAIASKTLTVDGGIATIKDGTTSVEVYTKDTADAKFVKADANNTFTGNNIFNGTITANQDVTMNADLVVNGDTTLGDVTADSVKAATLESTGNTKANSLEVTTTATITGMTNANGGLTTGNLVLGGNSLTGADTGAAAITTGAANTVATTATVLKSAENATFTPGTATSLAGQTTITGAINALGGDVDDIIDDITVAADGEYIVAGADVATNLGNLDTQVKQNADDIADIVTDITVAADGEYIVAGADVAGNLGALDTQVKQNADDIAANAIIGTAATSSAGYAADATVKEAVVAIDGALKTAEDDIDDIQAKITVAADGDYISAGDGVADNLTALDTAVKNVADKNDVQDTAIGNIYTALNGGTYVPADGSVTGATALSTDFAADNLTAAANELLTDITVAADGNYITAGADVKGNLGALDSAIGKVAAGTYNAIAPADNVATNLQALDAAFTNGSIDAVFGDTTVDSLTIGTATAITASGTTLDFAKNSLINVQGLTLTDASGNTGVLSADADGIHSNTDFSVNGDLAAEDGTFTGNISAVDGTFTGDISAVDGTFTGDVQAASLESTGNTKVGGDLDVDGTATVATLAVENNGSVGGDLTVTGMTNANGGVTTGNLILSGQSLTAVDTGAAAVTTGSPNTVATTATVLKSAENGSYTGQKVKGFTDSTTLHSALDETTKALNNILITDGSMVDDAKVYVEWNDDDSDLATVLGDGEYANEYNITAGDSITDTFDAIDAAIGDRSNIGSLNTAINTATASSVAEGLAAAGDAIGDLQYAAPTAVAYGDLTANTDLTTVAAQIAYNIGAAVTNETNGVDADASVNANIDAINTAMGDVSTLDVNGYDATAADANLVAGVNALNDNMEAVLGDIYADDGTYDNTALLDSTNPNGFAAGATDLTDALTKYAANVQAAMGTEYEDDGTFANDYEGAHNGVSYYGLTSDTDLVSAIAQLEENIGEEITGVDRDATLAAATTSADNTINANIDALDAAIGDLDYTGGTVSYELANGSATTGIKTLVATIGTQADNTYKNLDAAGAEATINDNLDALDAAIGDRSNIASKNDAINQGTARNVAAGLKAAGDAIGDMNFGQSHYVSAQNDLSGAVRTLDSNLYRVETDLHDLKRDLNRGMASMAAMSALVPNPRAHGNTSLAIGTGAYSGHTAAAIGGFHYLTDNIMLNAGAAWGNSRDVSYRMGVTFSW